MAKVATEHWLLGGIPISVEKDSEDEKILRVGELGPLDSSKTVFHFGGSESYDRELTGTIWNYSGYVNEFMPLIGSGYHTLVSDIENEGDYFIVSCKPERLQDFSQCEPNNPVRLQIELKKQTEPPEPPVPVWPGIVYYATASAVYRTDTFGVSKESDPTWSAISMTGFSGNLWYFALDNTQDTGELWAASSNYNVYKFNGSSWSVVLSTTEIQSWDAGAALRSIVNDPITGYIYAWAHTDDNAAKYRTWVDIHDGNGFQVLTSSQLFAGSYNWLRGLGNYNVYNGQHTIDYTSDLVGYIHRVNYSSNGSTWSTYQLGASSNTNSISWLDNVDTDTLYYTHSTGVKLYRAIIPTSYGAVCSSASPTNCFDRLQNTNRFRFMTNPDNANIVRFIPNYGITGHLVTTSDKFTTYTDQGLINVGASKAVRYIVPRVNTEDWDMIIYGANTAYSSSPHLIYTAYGSSDLSPTGKSGAMAGTSPYTDSIPYTVGGPVQGGIQFIDFTELE